MLKIRLLQHFKENLRNLNFIMWWAHMRLIIEQYQWYKRSGSDSPRSQLSQLTGYKEKCSSNCCSSQLRQLSRCKKWNVAFKAAVIVWGTVQMATVASSESWLVERWSSSDRYNNQLRQLLNWFCGIVHRRKTFSLISSRGHCLS